MIDQYYQLPEVSNSDLTWLKKQLHPKSEWGDIERAYAMGNLVDAMITEPQLVDHYRYRLFNNSYQFTAEDFERSREMKKAFDRDAFCQQMVKQCAFQKVVRKAAHEMEYDGVRFSLNMRCRFDLYCEGIDLSGDIKSTTATTQKQAEEAMWHFDYPRSRALYMDLGQRSNDILIFISKVNFKVFKIPVKRDSDIYRSGKRDYQELAYWWWTLFDQETVAA